MTSRCDPADAGYAASMTETTVKPFAVVTGASSGIGLELARQFADHGFDLLVCAEDAGLAGAAARLAAAGRYSRCRRT